MSINGFYVLDLAPRDKKMDAEVSLPWGNSLRELMESLCESMTVADVEKLIYTHAVSSLNDQVRKVFRKKLDEGVELTQAINETGLTPPTPLSIGKKTEADKILDKYAKMGPDEQKAFKAALEAQSEALATTAS